MIDTNALSALATATLSVQYPEAKSEAGQGPNGCDDADLIALEILGLSEGQGVAATTAFCIGFGFALQLGARLVLDPLRQPSVRDLIEQSRSELAEARAANLAPSR